MSAQRISQTTEVRNTAQRMPLLATGATVLAAAVIGFAAWQADRGGSGAETGEAAANGAALTAPVPGVRNANTAQPGLAIFLVGSNDEAVTLRGLITEVDNIRAQVGQQPYPSLVMVAGPDADLMVKELPQPPGTSVHDLRVP